MYGSTLKLTLTAPVAKKTGRPASTRLGNTLRASGCTNTEAVSREMEEIVACCGQEFPWVLEEGSVI